MTGQKQHLPVISVSFLLLGNCLGIGVLALPSKSGLSGFIPAMVGILFVWIMMLISAFVIGYKINLEKSDTFDIPSFFAKETNTVGKWVAIVCNLILLYGVLVAYLSGMTTILKNIISFQIDGNFLTVIYFMLTTALILFGAGIMRKGNMLIIVAVWISFGFLVANGMGNFDPARLDVADWTLFPIGLPVAVSAFHFHNIIPTVSRSLQHDVHATRKAIFIGVGLGLLINVIWVVIVLGSLQRMGLDPNTIEECYWHNLPATIPMSDLLHSKIFQISGFIFAFLAVTASYIANGTGLYGFVQDMTTTYLKTSNKLLVASLAFVPPLAVTLIYPNIFLSALDVVGGIGETVLFLILPGYILTKLCHKKFVMGYLFGAVMIVCGMVITAYVILDKLGIVDLVPAMPLS